MTYEDGAPIWICHCEPDLMHGMCDCERDQDPREDDTPKIFDPTEDDYDPTPEDYYDAP